MPAFLPPTNDTTLWSIIGYRSSEPKVQSIFFNTIIILFAAATLIVACLQLLHQRMLAQQDSMFTHTITILRIVMLIILDTGTPPYQRTRRAADPDHGSADILSSQAGDEGMELEELEEIPRHAASEVLTIVA
jgi:hypothetical protein